MVYVSFWVLSAAIFGLLLPGSFAQDSAIVKATSRSDDAKVIEKCQIVPIHWTQWHSQGGPEGARCPPPKKNI